MFDYLIFGVEVYCVQSHPWQDEIQSTGCGWERRSCGCGATKAPSADEGSGQTFHKGFRPEEVAKEAESSSGTTKDTEGLRASRSRPGAGL